MSQKDKGGGARKYDRNRKSGQNAAYQREMRRTKNKAKRLVKHLKRFPADTSALRSYEVNSASHDKALLLACKQAHEARERACPRAERKAMSEAWKAEHRERAKLGLVKLAA